jgi:riboflavin biosynthesis pyrimidine reductase
LEHIGVEILAQPLAAAGGISLPKLVATLHRRGIRRLMVEGGQGILSAFLRERLVDWLVITISPHLVGGLPALREIGNGKSMPRLVSMEHCSSGPDLLVWGQPIWKQSCNE